MYKTKLQSMVQKCTGMFSVCGLSYVVHCYKLNNSLLVASSLLV